MLERVKPEAPVKNAAGDAHDRETPTDPGRLESEAGAHDETAATEISDIHTDLAVIMSTSTETAAGASASSTCDAAS